MIGRIRLSNWLWSLVFCASLGSSAIAAQKPAFRWVQAWGASPHADFGKSSGRQIDTRTLVQRVRVSTGGGSLRIKVSNELGDVPLHIAAAAISVIGEGKGGPPHAVTFGGRPGLILPPGAPALSDAVALSVQPLEQIEIRLFLTGPTRLKTINSGFYRGLIVNGISPPGDYSMARFVPMDETLNCYAFLSGIDVQPGVDTKVLVAFGDSITAGLGPGRSWPDKLAEALVGEKSPMKSPFAVVNAGIGGNMLLRSDKKSANALARFDRDVLATTGVSHVVVFLGLNDIGIGMGQAGARSSVEDWAAEIIAAYQQLILRARAHGLKIFGATLTPFQGAEKYFDGYYTAEGEEVRQLVNRWIRMHAGFDAVIDLDKSLRDPASARSLLPEYDSGDHLHPSDAGHVVIATEVERVLFR